MGVAQQPQPQSQAAPQPPILANILIQKKEQKSLLLESVIDFASLVFHCVGSAITNKEGGGVLRTQQKQREITFKYT